MKTSNAGVFLGLNLARTVVGCALSAGMVACAGDPPKGAPPPTPEQVRSHADRTFDKLKQEEKERGAEPGSVR